MLKNSSRCDKDIQMYAVNAAIDNIQGIRSHSLRELLRLDYLNKKEATQWIELLINIAIWFP